MNKLGRLNPFKAKDSADISTNKAEKDKATEGVYRHLSEQQAAYQNQKLTGASVLTKAPKVYSLLLLGSKKEVFNTFVHFFKTPKKVGKHDTHMQCSENDLKGGILSILDKVSEGINKKEIDKKGIRQHYMFRIIQMFEKRIEPLLEKSLDLSKKLKQNEEAIQKELVEWLYSSDANSVDFKHAWDGANTDAIAPIFNVPLEKKLRLDVDRFSKNEKLAQREAFRDHIREGIDAEIDKLNKLQSNPQKDPEGKIINIEMAEKKVDEVIGKYLG